MYDSFSHARSRLLFVNSSESALHMKKYYGLHKAFCYTPVPVPTEASRERLRPPPLNPRQVSQR